MESMREEAGPAERMLLIRVIWDRAAVAGPTVRDASSSMIVSICKYDTEQGQQQDRQQHQ